MKKIAVFCACALLAACSTGEVRDTLGLKRDAPDEFRVVSRPPLSVPPDFTLQKPDPGAPPRMQVNPEKEASRIFLQEDGSVELTDEPQTLEQSDVETALPSVIETDMPTSAESMLLGKLGVDEADPEIRNKLFKEERDGGEENTSDDRNQTVLDRLIGGDAGEAVVDPFKESERIQENKEEGKPINEGEVPVIDKSNESVIDKLF